MSVQEQAAQMIHNLSDENVRYLIDFMQRFMISEDKNIDDKDFIREIEDMRIRAKACFLTDFDSDAIWEEAMDEKYGSID